MFDVSPIRRNSDRIAACAALSIPRCATFPRRWLRHAGEGSWPMLLVARRNAGLEISGTAGASEKQGDVL
jgi:hypothetical protein